ncbi:galactose-1-phosphate uridylyltransferase [Limosilactobacillus reuteri]|jgi:UDPglucose--hexose-1-phosphate uridylyltransferase|uniref:Galactose-1-phosphate uridylyltransferase n=3 Tax=Limosilactobacillus reuteri TaxID=1598 RepID=A0A143Q0Z1_LIMRT|nr:UDP-glucose--hexose-1-phosphate uridylyltransferase [Limosilactobacillus reuteri]CCC03634.1 galactose-1-phosphate uridylyltransferase [Limosilactobacillus reuteri subsp. suis]AGN98478.1 galactose-1-phosphate uridylyltransferase [Limosilactobacillus reuteri I5007]AMY14281.1 galactose-1-phosphate uridylyltransferase [Limosilactobacillus reuteri]MCC4339848.1 UDP-glucose--hexose-1-phosphate uridylyltransferase [Limosilactobacillus reuteri]MCC4346723.1 UDP-glucose--hexose-1-phosphate uridylyltra
MKLMEKFADQVIASGTYEPLDRIYVLNKIRGFVGDEDVEAKDDEPVVSQLVDLAVKRGKIDDGQTAKEILNDQLYDLMTPTPSVVNHKFWEKYQQSPSTATDWFYNLCTSNDYVKVAAIKKNVVFDKPTKYGNLEITINLSKPEKDPKAIAAAAHDTAKKYPQCALCMENEGYKGRLGQAARSNHRIIRITVGGQQWGFQYSPYAYFHEHCIFLDSKHEPMKINRQTLINLVEIEKQFPDYFVGSNADLPIVGGSMLAHEHYQGGKHIFPMMKASIKKELHFAEYPAVDAGIVNWPMSDIRLTSTDTEQLIDLGTHIIKVWDQYSDESLNIKAFDGQARHHTVTPIMHREGDKFVLDLVLRDNNTNNEYPLGIFHPHKKLWHIKKENIGLIEVMGRAILPARLKDELNEVKKFWLGAENKIADSHLPWAKEVQSGINITADNVDEVMEQELANVFANVLENAGVFKDEAAGNEGWQRFVDALK